MKNINELIMDLSKYLNHRMDEENLDDDEKTGALAAIFFKELMQRENAIYILSSLMGEFESKLKMFALSKEFANNLMQLIKDKKDENV